MDEKFKNSGITVDMAGASEKTGPKKSPFVVPAVDVSSMNDDPLAFVMPSIEGGEDDL